jgi:hypothetical protein
MVEGEGALQPIGGEVSGIPEAASVVDQHIDSGKALEDLVGQPPHLRLVRQVGHEHLGLPPSGGVDLTGRAFGGHAVLATDRQAPPSWPGPGRSPCRSRRCPR